MGPDQCQATGVVVTLPGQPPTRHVRSRQPRPGCVVRRETETDNRLLDQPRQRDRREAAHSKSLDSL
jgi:hypothetical protein